MGCALTAGAADPSDTVTALPVERVWAGHPVGFCLLTQPPYQFVAYYDARRRMSVAQRRLGSKKWTITKLPSALGWDSHNYVTLALDRDGFLHLSGNMHCVPLVYFRSERPFDATSLVRVKKMVGERESRVTYPVFLHDLNGRLVFRYRDGGSGNGDDLYNVYDERSRAWRRLMEQPLTSGKGRMNAYCTTPKLGPDGRFHVVWVWRDTPDCASNHDLSYARSADLVHWTDASGRPLTLPITLENSDIVDPVPPGGGLLNVNREVGFDNAGRPVVTYHKYDAHGDLQVYAARHDGLAWRIIQISDWKGYRWEFSGGGAIVVEVKVGAVSALGEGRLALKYRRPGDAGVWVLDEETLRPIPGAKAPAEPPLLPRRFRKIESTFPGMVKRTRTDSGKAPPGVRYVLTWETLPANRDRPRRPPLPEPSMLRVLCIPAGSTAREH
ncbi:MAG: BNR repeat-containing protein [Verrucomicrobia bacterium]|nr:BNR repeat-containing protein [Verrucomicrobiota bacterium]